MQLDPQRVWKNAREATTVDLLDRLTAFRDGLEPAAKPILEAELRERGIGPMEIHAHGLALEGKCLKNSDGTVARCSLCLRPAVAADWNWFRLWRVIPIFPWKFLYCQDHARLHSTDEASRHPSG
ncbi:MAG: hypothetical protein HY040_03470 [Planctomycetes bacterium]|nr:hypothetical protein [Planctomycetota bacterium]